MKDSFYLSRLYLDINSCIKHINHVYSSRDFLKDHKEKYLEFIDKDALKENGIPFSLKHDLDEMHKMIFCKIWDSFILYLKLLIIAAEIENKSLTKNKEKEISQYKFNQIQKALNDLKIVPKNQSQWNSLKKIKIYRDKITHQHELENSIKMLHFQSKDFMGDNVKIKLWYISETAKFILGFCKKIDEEFLKNYPKFIKSDVDCFTCFAGSQ